MCDDHNTRRKYISSRPGAVNAGVARAKRNGRKIGRAIGRPTRARTRARRRKGAESGHRYFEAGTDEAVGTETVARIAANMLLIPETFTGITKAHGLV